MPPRSRPATLRAGRADEPVDRWVGFWHSDGMLLKGNGVGMSRRLLAVVVFGLVGVACRGETVSSSTTTMADTTTTTVVETTTSSTVASTTVPEGFVGDPVAIEEHIELAMGLARSSPESFPEGALELEIPWPENTTADPVVALQEIWEFDAWVASVFPYDVFAELYLAPDSPAWREAGELVRQLDQNNWIIEFDGPGFVWVSGGVGEPSDVPADVEIPVGGVVVRYRSSQSDVTVYWVDDGTVVERGTGYPEEDRVAVLVPSALGWQLYWYGDPA